MPKEYSAETYRIGTKDRPFQAAGSIRSFSELETDRNLAGAKADRLAQLFQAGYPVPDGFIVLP